MSSYLYKSLDYGEYATWDNCWGVSHAGAQGHLIQEDLLPLAITQTGRTPWTGAHRWRLYVSKSRLCSLQHRVHQVRGRPSSRDLNFSTTLVV